MEMERRRPSGLNSGVKIGGLWKRSQGLSRFTKTNYKHRVFILTEHSLSYYSGTVDRVGQMKRRVNLSTVRAVEFVDELAFNLAHTFQVVYVSKKHGFVILYITATDKVECAEWVSSIRQACYFNSDMLMHHHPGALLKNKWSCCQQQGKTTLGCQPTYHLLTRSSSRYAQMRRRDTLTSSQNSRRRSKANSVCAVDRRSIASGIHNVVEVVAEVCSKPGEGLSNSCMDLTHHPPHEFEIFSSGTSPSSHRSSRQSTEPSVSLGSITLTRVPVLDTPTSEGGGELDGCGREMEGTLEVQRREARTEKKRSRSQVAPEINPMTLVNHFPTDQFEPEEKTVAKPTIRPRGRSLGNEGMQPFAVREESPPPVPPRHRHFPSFTGSISFIPSVTPISEGREPVPARGMTHSKTFVVPSPVTHPRKLRNFSCSTSALSMPLIEPRISSTDPNVIHV